jgi:SAM-dependent methyltransferase
MTGSTLGQVVSDLTRSADALAAIGAALAARHEGVPLPPALQPHVEAVVDALGLREALDQLPAAEAAPMLGQIRVFALTNAKLFSAPPGEGWTHAEPEILQAAGDASAGFPAALRARIAPALDGLAGTLSRPGAAFLDIGVGVASLSIAMARSWPGLRIVGLEPWPAALAMARRAVMAAGLGQRIELREQAAQELPDVQAFDLAWLPSLFVPRDAIAPSLAAVRRALRPGGWLLVPILRPTEDTLAGALARLRVAMFGGWPWLPDELEALLLGQGFAEIRILPAPPHAVTGLLAARRPPERG